MGLRGRLPQRFKRTDEVDPSKTAAPNVLKRRFDVSSPNRAWVGDITYVRTWEGWLYLAVIIDLFSRRVVGWSAGSTMDETLVHRALRMALSHRDIRHGLLHYTDRGSQYTASNYREALEARGIRCSMSRKGNCWDNAVAESFFATLKQELIHRYAWPTRADAKKAIAEYIEVFYNVQRLHSTLGYVSPARYETLNTSRREAR